MPTVSVLPAAPSRLTDNPDQFVLKADAFAAALEAFPGEINALASYLGAITSGVDFNSTSATSLTIGTGSKTLTVQTGKLYIIGQWVLLASTASPANYMVGQVTAYTSGTGSLTVNVTATSGSGTLASWTVGMAAVAMGGTLTQRLVTVASSSGGAGFSLPHGVAPAAPGDGDLWTTTSGLFGRINGTVLRFATLDGAETFTNKTLTTPVLSAVASGTTAGKLGYAGGLLTYGDGTAQRTVVTTDGAQTLSNKVITQGIYAITDGAGFAINPGNGAVQTVALGANRTPTASGWANGSRVWLMVDDGAGYTIDWSTVAVTWIGGTAPTLAATGYTVIELWQVGGTIYGTTHTAAVQSTSGITYVGGTTAAAATANSPSTTSPTISLTALTGGLAAAPVADDFVVVVLSVSGAADLTLAMTSSGWTKDQDLYANASSADANLAIFYKKMGSTPDTSFTLSIPVNGTSNAYAVAVQVFRGVDTTTPLDVTTTTGSLASSILADAPSNTPKTSRNLVLAIGAGAYTGATGRAFSSATLANVLSANGTNTTTSALAVIGQATPNLIAAFDPPAFTFSGVDSTTFSSCAATMILKGA